MMHVKFFALLLVVSLLPLHATQPDGVGKPPAARFAARDIFKEYNLPPLMDHAADALQRSIQHTQVLLRAKRLSLNTRAATAVWMAAGDLYANQPPASVQTAENDSTPFIGTTASELNAMLALPETRAIKVSAPALHMDVPLSIRRDGVALDFGESQIVSGTTEPYLIRIEGAKDVSLHGGVFTGHGWAVLVSRSHHVVISKATVQQTTGGFAITDSTDVVLRDNELHGIAESPILLHGDTHGVLVLRNQIGGNMGNSNWHAGIVISDRNADVATDPRDLMRSDNYGVKEQPITARLAIPTNNLITFNMISGNASSGIYSDGGSKNVFTQNTIEGNSKEGFCLDNGSSANVVVFNVIRANGKRWGKTDNDLQRDFVLALGRLPDGSSRAKLPGVSIDNAAYNQILFNNVHENYGGGIKFVRTAFYNVVGMNTLNENNEGRSSAFHFFGVELGAAPADTKVPDLDFTPSRGNEIFGNTIRGAHYAGIFFATGSDGNIVFDNAIFGATYWAMESIQQERNRSFNNLSNLRSRNISTGLDPALVALGSGR